MFNSIPAIVSASSGAGSSFPVQSDLEGLWDANVGVTGTAPVTIWSDQSGNGRDWIEDTGSGGAGPTLTPAALNGLPVMTFDGVDDKMSQSAFFSGTAGGYTKSCVVRRTTSNNKGWNVFGSSSTQPHFMFGNLIYETFGASNRPAGLGPSAFSVNTWGVYLVTVDDNGGGTGDMLRYANNVLFGNQPINKGWHTTFRLGSGSLIGTVGSTNSFQGEIAEMAVWSRVLTTQEQTDVFDYFNDKYALGL